MSDKFCCFGIFIFIFFAFNFFAFVFNRFLFSRFSFHHFFVLVLVFVNEFVIFSFFVILFLFSLTKITLRMTSNKEFFETSSFWSNFCNEVIDRDVLEALLTNNFCQEQVNIIFSSNTASLVTTRLQCYKVKINNFDQNNLHQLLLQLTASCSFYRNIQNTNKKLSYCRDSARCETAIQGHSRSSVVVPIDFLLVLNSNLTSPLSSTVLEISRLVCTSTPHLSSRWKWKKTAGSRWTYFGVRVPRTLDYPTINLDLH